MNEDQKYQRAVKRMEEEKGFYTHLLTYILVSIFLIVLNTLTSRHIWWYWPLGGWGIGILLHGIGVFGFNPLLGKRWEERRIQKIMERDEEA